MDSNKGLPFHTRGHLARIRAKDAYHWTTVDGEQEHRLGTLGCETEDSPSPPTLPITVKPCDKLGQPLHGRLLPGPDASALWQAREAAASRVGHPGR